MLSQKAAYQLERGQLDRPPQSENPGISPEEPPYSLLLKHPFLHTSRQLLNLLNPLRHIRRGQLGATLVRRLIEVGHQRQQLVRIVNKLVLSLDIPHRLLLDNETVSIKSGSRMLYRLRRLHRLLLRLLCRLSPACR